MTAATVRAAKTTIRLAVVDDHPLFVHGLELLLPAMTGGRRLVGMTGDAVGFLPQSSEPEELLPPLLAILDGCAVLPAPLLRRLRVSNRTEPAAPAGHAGLLAD
ncbi:hypothetical protein [Micromonospora sp. RTGN7]|uniref:hypothetical protein n=1 Tax=Micromonospora sp. RTGN7 TaxID=3016526 RepID=UPI0029FEFC4B|nr:hypothetical protein [Micromonospora sp. RTGN7]